MCISEFPTTVDAPEMVSCAICGKQITLDLAVAGTENMEGELTFLCGGHFWDSAKFISGWADFMAAERLRNYYDGRQAVLLRRRDVGSLR